MATREYAAIDFSHLTVAEKYTVMTALGESRSERAYDLYQKLTSAAAEAAKPVPGQLELPLLLPVAEYRPSRSAAGSCGWAL